MFFDHANQKPKHRADARFNRGGWQCRNNPQYIVMDDLDTPTLWDRLLTDVSKLRDHMRISTAVLHGVSFSVQFLANNDDDIKNLYATIVNAVAADAMKREPTAADEVTLVFDNPICPLFSKRISIMYDGCLLGVMLSDGDPYRYPVINFMK